MEQCRFPNRLKKYRRYFSFSQKEVAKLLGLNDTSPLSRWEKGLVFPNISYLFRLCRIYKTMPQELYAELWENVTKEISSIQANIISKKESDINNKIYHL